VNTLSGLINIDEVLPYLLSDCYLSKRAAAGYISISVRTLEGLPNLRRYRVGKVVRYRRSELDAWMKAHVEAPGKKIEKLSGLRGLLTQAKKRALEQEADNQTGGQED
jgi:hypothetical protein